jgi:hypothetical protein
MRGEILRDLRVRRRAKTVRNDLLDPCTRLADQHGMSGLMGNESDGQGDKFIVQLGQRAVRSGNGADEDLNRLEVESSGRPRGEPG